MENQLVCANTKLIAASRIILWKTLKNLKLEPNIRFSWRFITFKHMNDRIEISLKIENVDKKHAAREIITKYGSQAWTYKLPVKKTNGGFYYDHKFIYVNEDDVEQKLQEAITSLVMSMISIIDTFGARLDL